MKLEHKYVRGGAVAYLAAWDVVSGRVLGRCEWTTGIEQFERLVDAVMTQEPYRSADRVFGLQITARCIEAKPPGADFIRHITTLACRRSQSTPVS